MLHPEYNADLFPSWITISTRFRDLDPLNHVNNALFSTFYEEARIGFIEQVPAFSGQLQNGYSFVLATIRIDFIKPVQYPADILVGSGITKIGNSSISSFQAIYHKEDKSLVSTAEASGVWFNLQTQRPARIPEIENRESFMLNEELAE